MPRPARPAPSALPVEPPEDELRQLADGTHPRPWTLLGAHAGPAGGPGRDAIRRLGAERAIGEPRARPGDGRADRLAMRRLGDSGVWSCFAPGIGAGDRYRFAVTGADGQTTLRADPMARWTELRPGTASRVAAPSAHAWGDADWLAARRSTDLHRSPMRIYEVHLGSWRRRPDGGWLSYREIGAAAGRALPPPRVHARRADADRRAPVRRLVGLPGDRLLRADLAPREPRRPALDGRRAASGRDRRDPRLGAGPLPAGRARAGPLRRHGAVRAPATRCAASIPTGGR